MDSGRVDEAQPAEVEHQALWLVGKDVADGLIGGWARCEIPLAVERDRRRRSPLGYGDPQALGEDL